MRAATPAAASLGEAATIVSRAITTSQFADAATRGTVVAAAATTKTADSTVTAAAAAATAAAFSGQQAGPPVASAAAAEEAGDAPSGGGWGQAAPVLLAAHSLPRIASEAQPVERIRPATPAGVVLVSAPTASPVHQPAPLLSFPGTHKRYKRYKCHLRYAAPDRVGPYRRYKRYKRYKRYSTCPTLRSSG